MDRLSELVSFVEANGQLNDKAILSAAVTKHFDLVKDRSVFACSDFAIRFSTASTANFSNTVLSLSNLQKYDDRPFVVCLSTPSNNYLFLANTTFLKKISHSSQELRVNNIKGSFNGSDIFKDFEGILNSPENFDTLYKIHEAIGFEDNLARLVEATNGISPTGKRFEVSESARLLISTAPERAECFVKSCDWSALKAELDEKVDKFKNEIVLASLIENVNIRGRVIEYIIAGKDDQLRQEIIDHLRNRSHRIPQFKTENKLGDYSRSFDDFLTETDVKTKIMVLDSNPKAYNIDKILDFLATEKSVFMFYFVGVNPTEIVNTVLVSMFQKDLLESTLMLKHWAGRNSRGVTQFEGKQIAKLIESPSSTIDIAKAKAFLEQLVNL